MLAQQQFSSVPDQNPVQQPSTALRLRDDPPPITPTTRSSRKRKSSPANPPDQSQQQQQHSQMHLPPTNIQFPSSSAFPFGAPPYGPPGVPQPTQAPEHTEQSASPPASLAVSRALSNSKRAEQNRKAQRAFRERRDQHVKALESRSQLLDAALASADEANRRWEECRALVDQLRIENAALRAELGQVHAMSGNGGKNAENDDDNK